MLHGREAARRGEGGQRDTRGEKRANKKGEKKDGGTDGGERTTA